MSTHDEPGRVPRVAAAAVLAFSVLFAGVEIGRIAFTGSGRDVAIAAVATSAAIVASTAMPAARSRSIVCGLGVDGDLALPAGDGVELAGSAGGSVATSSSATARSRSRSRSSCSSQDSE